MLQSIPIFSLKNEGKNTDPQDTTEQYSRKELSIAPHRDRLVEIDEKDCSRSCKK